MESIRLYIFYPEKTWEEFSPKCGVVFRPDKNTAIRASISRGFRAPTLFELYKTHTRRTGVTIANPNLEPEKIVSYDLGAEKVFFDTVWARITYYQSYAEELIAGRTVSPNQYERDNLDDDLSEDIELFEETYTHYCRDRKNEERDLRDFLNYISFSPRNLIDNNLARDDQMVQIKI